MSSDTDRPKSKRRIMPAGGGGSALTVRDIDGVPTVLNVRTIRFTDGTVADDGNGQVTVTIAGGGTGSPDPPNQSVQYNNSGIFGGESEFLYQLTSADGGNIVRLTHAIQETNLRLERTGASTIASVQLNSLGNANFRRFETSSPAFIQLASGRTGPAFPNSLDILGRLEFVGSNAISFNPSIRIQAVASENQLSTNLGSGLEIATTANASSTLSTRLRINSLGTVNVGPDSAATVVTSLGSSSKFVVGNPNTISNSVATYLSVTGSADVKVLVVQGGTSQTVAIFDIQNSSGTALFSIGGAGSHTYSAIVTPPPVSPAGNGRIYFDSGSNKFKVSENAGAFVDMLGGGGSGLSDPGGNGIVVRTALNVTTARTLIGTTNRIVITNGDGVSGNPTFDIGTDVVTLTGTQTLTNKTLTASSNSLGGITMSLGSDATGDTYFRSSGVLTRLAIGASGQVLTVSAGLPVWAAAGGGSTPPFTDSNTLIAGSVDATKLMRFEIDGFTTSTTRVLTPPDSNIIISGSASVLTSGRIPFVTTNGLLLDNSSFQWDNTNNRINLTGGQSAIRLDGASPAASDAAFVLPFVGGSNSGGPGLRWAGSASFASQASIWISNGFNFQGHSSTGDPLKIRTGTGTSSDGSIIFEFRPSASLFLFNAETGLTSGRFELQIFDIKSTGTPVDGFGGQLSFTGKSSTTANRSMVSIDWRWSTASDATRSADLVFSNVNNAASLAETFRITANALPVWPATNTSVGTTGNQTINKPSGTVNIAASGTAVTVTNSLVTANSLVFAVIRTNDATARISNIVPAAGSFVVNIVACTAEVSIGFFVINK